MSEELFPSAAVVTESPRSAWIKKHGALTYHSRVEPFCWFAGFTSAPSASPRDWFGRELAKNGEQNVGVGETEDQALANLAEKFGVPIWTKGWWA